LKLVLFRDAYFFDRGDEPISVPRQSFDKPGIIGRIIEGFPKPHDGGVETVIEIHERVFGPEPLSQFFPGDDLAPPFEQYAEDSAGLFLKLNLPTLLPKLTGAQIDFVGTEAYELRRKGGMFA
jgi:hypothetical protein